MIERTGDPVRDADHYNREMEERPIKTYEACIILKTYIKVYGQTPGDAREDAEIKADCLQSNIISADNGDLMDCEIDEIKIKEMD